MSDGSRVAVFAIDETTVASRPSPRDEAPVPDELPVPIPTPTDEKVEASGEPVPDPTPEPDVTDDEALGARAGVPGAGGVSRG